MGVKAVGAIERQRPSLGHRVRRNKSDVGGDFGELREMPWEIVSPLVRRARSLSHSCLR